MRVSFSTEHKGLKGPYILGVKPATIMCKRQANTVDATQSRCLPALKAVLWIELREKLREKLRVGLFAILTVSLFTQVATAQESTGENADENASENAGENAGAGKGPKPSSEIKKGSAQSPEKKKSKKPKKRKKRAQDTQNKQNQPAKQEVAKPAAKKPQRFEILSVSDQTVAIEYTRPDASLKVGDLMYVVHGEQKGFVAVLEIELVEYAQKSLTARLIENDVEFSDNVTLSGLEVFTHQKFLEVADEYSQGPLHPKVPSAVSFFSQYSNRNPSLLIAGGIGISEFKETQFVVEEDKAPLASSTIQRAEVFLPEVFGQFWINWFGGGYEKFETNQAELVVKDGAGNIIDQASAVGSGSSAWVSLKPTLPYYIVSKIELRAELQRERMIKIESPLEFALTEKSVIQTTIQDTAPRYMVGYQSRLATFAFLQVTGVLPLQPEVTVTQVRANGQTEVQKAKLNEVNIDARISLHFTVTEAPHQFSFDTYIGGKYDQKAYVIKGVTQTQTIVTPYDLQPYVLFGLTYVK